MSLKCYFGLAEDFYLLFFLFFLLFNVYVQPVGL